MAKIYISSTYSDLQEYRQAAYDFLRSMRHDVVAMEDYPAKDGRPLDVCLADVAACQVYIGIVAWHYGHIPTDQERSITELEYQQACRSGLARFIFMLDQKVRWDPECVDRGSEHEKIAAWRHELCNSHVVHFFKDEKDFAEQVVASIAQWTQEQLDCSLDAFKESKIRFGTQGGRQHHSHGVVNVRPLDVVDTFKGREREQEELRDYLLDGGVHMVSVLGRGGMGKTALATRLLAELEQGEMSVRGNGASLPINGIVYLSAQNTRITLERLYSDLAKILERPVADSLAARWVNTTMSLAAKAEYLIEVMADGTYVFLMDNFEDELEADGTIRDKGLRAFVEQCVTKPSGAKLIVTSQEKLRLPAAALRTTRTISLSEGLGEDEAVELLRDLDPQGLLGLRSAKEADLRRAAKLTQGIPRALEILAGLLYEDPTTDLSEVLADRAVFSAGVMEPLVAAGYRRLEEPEKRVMEALAVFNDQVDETAIAYLTQPFLPALDVRASLRRLVNGHFVQMNAATRQYSLHALDREYAYGQIPQRA
ncbi:MAG: DUF4062 domain-containing protein [Alphaproteobacteria bacterium]|nr:DUF4062 domain-containing protein [Alphaproteobacteria bacterium]